MSILIDGKRIANEIRNNIKKDIQILKADWRLK